MRPDRRPSRALTGRSLIHQHLVALHRAVQLIRRNKQIVVAIGASIGPHKAIAIAMQIEPARHQPVARRAATTWVPIRGSIYARELVHSRRLLEGRRRQRPLLRLGLHQLAARGDPRQLLQQQTPLAPAAQPQLADQLFVSRAMSRRALNAPDQLAVRLWVRSLRHQLRDIPRLNRALSRAQLYYFAAAFSSPTACSSVVPGGTSVNSVFTSSSCSPMVLKNSAWPLMCTCVSVISQ